VTPFSASVAALAFLGTSTLAYTYIHSRAQRRKAEEIFITKTKLQKKSRSKAARDTNDHNNLPEFLRNYGGKRTVRLYFNQNDELVDE
jgi:hypothetical protein